MTLGWHRSKLHLHITAAIRGSNRKQYMIYCVSEDKGSYVVTQADRPYYCCEIEPRIPELVC